MNEQPFPTSAQESEKDYRTLTHSADMAGVVSPTGGIHYDTTKDLKNQRRIGKCTSISLIQNAQKVTGKKFSENFQYLMQKRADGNWTEGSSPFCALKIGKNIGFLPEELWMATTWQDDNGSYADYIAKLQAISESEVQRLISLCTDKLTGYTQVLPLTAENIASAIVASKAGIICRYATGVEWYTDKDGNISWDKSKINPISPLGRPRTGGHAINTTYYDYTINKMLEHPNTWGGSTTPDWQTVWDMDGICTTDFDKYPPTEAWLPLYDVVPQRIILPRAEDFHPTYQPCKLGDNSQAVKDLQTKLMILGILPLIKLEEWGYYGDKTKTAVYTFMRNSGRLSTYELLTWRGKNVGLKTITQLTLN